MGGVGSGRGRREALDRRRTTEELPALSVRALVRDELIAPAQEEFLVSFSSAFARDLRVRLTWTDASFGRSEATSLDPREPENTTRRPWFVCPGVGCSRRVATLYLEDDSSLLCRVCLSLAYPVQQERKEMRGVSQARARALKARRKLEAKLGPKDAPIVRPKGMHHRTFARLVREAHDAHTEHVALWGAWAGSTSAGLLEACSKLEPEEDAP